MLHSLAGFGDDHVRHQVAMAVTMIAFKAQQAASRFARQAFRLGQRHLGFRRFHMGIENRHHAFRVASPDSIAAGLGRAEALQVDVTDPRLVKTGRKLTL